MLQKEIPAYLQENNIRPSGLSSIEKRLNLMKEVLDFSKNEQLVAYCKDFGII
jgi:two-component system capsular synthesis response regulator RcsB